MEQAKQASRLIKDAGQDFDVAYTSMFKRAVWTLWHCLDQMNRTWLPVVHSWRLKERHDGTLPGLNKADIARQYGDEQLLVWRRNYDTPLPAMEPSNPLNERSDLRDAKKGPEDIPLPECLKDTVTHVLPFWEGSAAPAIELSGGCGQPGQGLPPGGSAPPLGSHRPLLARFSAWD